MLCFNENTHVEQKYFNKCTLWAVVYTSFFFQMRDAATNKLVSYNRKKLSKKWRVVVFFSFSFINLDTILPSFNLWTGTLEEKKTLWHSNYRMMKWGKKGKQEEIRRILLRINGFCRLVEKGKKKSEKQNSNERIRTYSGNVSRYSLNMSKSTNFKRENQTG